VKRLPGTVVALGAVSLLTDLSSEMIYPMLPAFLATLGAGAAFLGLIEGTADATAALTKLVSGVWSDHVGRRKPLVLLGYGLSSVVRPLIALAQAPLHVLGIRFADRLGKGLRSSPRDALIAQATPEDRRGAAYGFHRAMDHAGAMVGPLVAFALLRWGGVSYRALFALAAIPAAAAMIALFVFVKEAAAPKPARPSVPLGLHFGSLPRELYTYLGLVGVFTLANASDTFLLLRAMRTGIPVEYLPLLWALLHVVKSALSTPLGALSDRLGRKRVIVAGWIIYAAAYGGFAFADEWWQVVLLFVVYGAHFGMVEGAEKALVADLAPAHARGSAFGAFHFVVGVAALPASLGFGLLWDRLGHQAAFLVAASLAAVAAIGLIAFLRSKH
jgi:MFS family permease